MSHRTSSLVIHICSWPGAGKATIGRLLADWLNGRLIDNHLMIDPASALFDRGDARHAALREALRARIFGAAAELPKDVPLILTDALSDAPADRRLYAPVKALAAARDARLFPVTLELDLSENLKRLQSEDRACRSKLVDTGILRRLRADHHLLKPQGAMSVDVTNLTPQAAATAILRGFGLPGHEGDT